MGEDGSRIAPWFLDKPCESLDSFYELIRNLDDIEKGMVDKQFSSSSSYFVIDENDKLIGATRLAHYLTIDGLNTWGGAYRIWSKTIRKKKRLCY